MQIVLVISSLGPGGAQRNLVQIASKLAELGHSVTILTLTPSTEKPFYDLAPEIRLDEADFLRTHQPILYKIWEAVKLPFLIRRRISKLSPDIVVSFIDEVNIFCLLGTIGTGTPVIACERVYPGHGFIKAWDRLKVFQRVAFLVRNVVYSLAARIILQTEVGAQFFPGYLRRKIVVIPNAIVVEPTATPDISLPSHCIVGMGRLTKQKRFDLLIEAFARIAAQYPDWNVYIFGRGSLLPQLEEKVDELGLRERVCFPGLTSTAQATLAQADIFALTSDYEGFPTVLSEAMAQGVAVIATDCLTGPSELIENEENGILLPRGSIDGVAEALSSLMQNEEKRTRLGRNARAIVDRLNVGVVIQKWQSVLAEVEQGST